MNYQEQLLSLWLMFLVNPLPSESFFQHFHFLSFLFYSEGRVKSNDNSKRLIYIIPIYIYHVDVHTYFYYIDRCVFVNNFSNDGLKLYLKYSCFKFNPVDRFIQQRDHIDN